MKKPASGEGRIQPLLFALVVVTVAMVLVAPGAAGIGSSAGPVNLAVPLGPDTLEEPVGPIGILGPLASDGSGPVGALGPLGPGDAPASANRLNAASGAPSGGSDRGLGQSVGSLQAFQSAGDPFTSSGPASRSGGNQNCGVSASASEGSLAGSGPSSGGRCEAQIDTETTQTTGDTGAVEATARSGDATGGNAWGGPGGDVVFMCGIGGDGGGSGAVGGSGPYSGAVTGNYSRGGSGDGGDGGNGYCIVGSFSATGGNGGDAEGGPAESGDARVSRTSSGDSGDNAEND